VNLRRWAYIATATAADGGMWHFNASTWKSVVRFKLQCDEPNRPIGTFVNWNQLSFAEDSSFYVSQE